MILQLLQLELAEAIFSDKFNENLITPVALQIYRNTIMNNYIRALTSTYPMLVKLLGKDFFETAAQYYVEQYPCRTSDLNQYGEYLSIFLTDYSPTSHLSYLSEIAQFEWTCHTLFFTATSSPFDLIKLKSLSPMQYEQLRFQLNQASALLTFNYPLLQIYALCHENNDITLNLQPEKTYLLITQRDFEIRIVSLPAADFIFLSALHNGKPLGIAVKSALGIDQHFVLNDKLAHWIQNRIIIDCY